jgi:taurine dioxygenase
MPGAQMQDRITPRDHYASMQERAMERIVEFSVGRLTDSFGVEVTGVDLASCGPDVHRAIVETFDRHGVMVIRDQVLSPQEQIAFTKAFGAPEDNPRKEFTYPGLPEIYVISNKVVDGKAIGDPTAGQGWHTDSSFLAEPVKCTMLYAMEVPDEGSDTLLADLCAAWNALPPERQAALDGLEVHHSWRALMELKNVYLPPEDNSLPDVIHPMVRVHPADGRKALWVSTGTTRGVVGMPNPQGLDLLEELVAFATQERFVYRHKWHVGDVLIWDNRCTLHTGTPFDLSKYRRHVHRTWVRGVRPN